MSKARTLLVIGGARSGKSAFAQAQAEVSGLERVFVATAEVQDAEMAARVAAHIEARGDGWRTIEAPYDLATTLTDEAAAHRILLVDCLTLWLSNLMLRGDDVEAATRALAAATARSAGPTIFVSNEVGWGIVPENALARRFRDAQGRLNQCMARVCDHVVLVAAGVPLVLEASAPPVFDWRA